MSTLPPTKPIQSAWIRVSGDPSVGIPHQDFTMELYCVMTDLVDTMTPEEAVNTLRDEIAKLYETWHGESVTVLFDFEIAAIQENERRSEEEERLAEEEMEHLEARADNDEYIRWAYPS